MKAKTIIPPSSIEEIQQLKQLIRVQTKSIENLSSSLWHSIIADEPPAEKSYSGFLYGCYQELG